jgi:hypothetical protein
MEGLLLNLNSFLQAYSRPFWFAQRGSNLSGFHSM